MRKFFMLCGLVLIAVAGCSSDKETKTEAANNTPPAKQASRESKSAIERPKTKLTLTEEKLNEVQNLKEKLKEKKEILDKKAVRFTEDIRTNVAEINAERAKNGLKEFPQAVTNAVIEQCLKAIQKAKAYKELSEREANKTWLAVIEVTGTEKQLRLDKTLFEDLDETQIEEILRQIDFVLIKVKPQAEEFKVTDENTVREPLEKLYEEYIRKDEREREQKELNQKRLEEQRQKSAAKKNTEKTAPATAYPETKNKATAMEKPKQTARKIGNLRPFLSRQTADYDIELMTWNLDGTLLATGENESLVVWDIPNNKYIIKPFGKKIQSIRWSSTDTNTLVAISEFEQEEAQIQIFKTSPVGITEMTEAASAPNCENNSYREIEEYSPNAINVRIRFCESNDQEKFFIISPRPGFPTIASYTGPTTTMTKDGLPHVIHAENPGTKENFIAIHKISDDTAVSRLNVCPTEPVPECDSGWTNQNETTYSDVRIIKSMAWNPVTKLLAVAHGEPPIVTLLDVNTGKKISVFKINLYDNDTCNTFIQWSPEYGFLHLHHCSRHIMIDGQTGNSVMSGGSTVNPRAPHYYAHAYRAEITIDDIRFPNENVGKLLNEESSRDVEQLSWSPSGKYVAAAYKEYPSTICVWNVSQLN